MFTLPLNDEDFAIFERVGGNPYPVLDLSKNHLSALTHGCQRTS